MLGEGKPQRRCRHRNKGGFADLIRDKQPGDQHQNTVCFFTYTSSYLYINRRVRVQDQDSSKVLCVPCSDAMISSYVQCVTTCHPTNAWEITWTTIMVYRLIVYACFCHCMKTDLDKTTESIRNKNKYNYQKMMLELLFGVTH